MSSNSTFDALAETPLPSKPRSSWPLATFCPPGLNSTPAEILPTAASDWPFFSTSMAESSPTVRWIDSGSTPPAACCKNSLSFALNLKSFFLRLPRSLVIEMPASTPLVVIGVRLVRLPSPEPLSTSAWTRPAANSVSSEISKSSPPLK